MPSASKRLTADDFFAGLFAALACKGMRSLSLRNSNFEEAIARTFEQVRDQAAELDLDLRFRIYLDPLHGDSATIWDSLSKAAQRDLVSFANPEFMNIRVKMDEEGAATFLGSLPIEPSFYEGVAERFLSEYRTVSS